MNQLTYNLNMDAGTKGSIFQGNIARSPSRSGCKLSVLGMLGRISFLLRIHSK